MRENPPLALESAPKTALGLLGDPVSAGLKWRSLTEAEARSRRDFGLRGWLGAAAALNLLLLTMLGFLLLRLWTEESAPPELMGESAPFTTLRWYFTLCALALLLFQVGAWTKWRHAPEAAVGGLAFIAGLTMALDLCWPPHGAHWSGILANHAASWVVFGLIGLWLMRGHGPNLTFKRRIRRHAA
ncbi:hypothetical protein [Neomegalonema sp.]|uniref:hypothetical protein n=1 Tax=Neomegalonema sp. TaxID=2039713 RepID=UPI002612C9B9|nr:hypothetical protein [Neomegalonema sp.]MDD2869047.1 hypothetical protein [Neomegalonema sp.]